MSDLIAENEAIRCSGNSHESTIQVHPAREAMLGGGLKIRRALPVRARRMIGPWCFLDHFGPLAFEGKAMDVGSHPHIGLQTVTWLLDGEVLHKDSLGYEQIIRSGQLNLMTAGRGITHSEETPPNHSGRVHGVQFWVALPDKDRHCEPAFEHHPELPELTKNGATIKVFMGEAMGGRSPVHTYSPMMAVDIEIKDAGAHCFPLNPKFEHAILILEGSCQVNDLGMEIGSLYGLGLGRREITIQTAGPVRMVMVGGEPFAEEILMWWNFVARTPAEIKEAIADWENHRRFGPVEAYSGERLSAPSFNF